MLNLVSGARNQMTSYINYFLHHTTPAASSISMVFLPLLIVLTMFV
jgi:hypothetical protein